MTVFEGLLNHEFDLERRQRAADGQGGSTVDYAPYGTVRGRIRPASSSEREQAALQQRQISHVFYCLAGEDVKRGDRLSLAALVVSVVAVREPSEAGEHYEIDCLETQVEENL